MEIHIRNLEFSFSGSPSAGKREAISESTPFRLSIPKMELTSGSHHAWVGPSGSGKTTGLRLIAGILQPQTCDSLRIGSQELNQMPSRELRLFRAQRLGLVFQDFKLLEYLNVEENILLPTRLSKSKYSVSELRERVVHLLDRVGLKNKKHRPVTQLSQGEQQRVAICRALLLRPQLVLADEPTGNLDPTSKTRIMNLLRQECSEIKSTLLVVTHDHALLEGMDSVTDFSDFYAQRQEGKSI